MMDVRRLFYWSSTHASNTSLAWFVGFYYGSVGNNDKSNSYYVRDVQ